MSILLEEERNDVLLLTLNRPEARNALSGQLAERLAAKLESIADRRDLRAVIITGSGDKAFCAGADLKERRDMNADQKWAQRGKLWRVNMLLWRAAQPVIAAVNGFCMGGGFEMALFSDFRIAVPEAVFSFPEMSLGAYPGAGGPIALPRLIGRARAKEILFSARRVTAGEALELGIIEDVVPGADLQDRAFALANSFKASSPRGVAGVKRLINLGADLSIDMAGDLNDAIRRPLEASADYEEGINAFFEKRKPVFRGD
jgi:enoyl-CoA hydratase/carnithine racemase